MNLQYITFLLGDILSFIINSWFFLVICASFLVFYKTKTFNMVSFLLIAILSSFFYVFYNSTTGNGIALSVSSVGYPQNI
jgi:hypothetical protein